MKRVLCATQDYGGINAVMPVVERLRKRRGIEVDLIINNEKHEQGKRIDDLSIDNMMKILATRKPDLVLVGTGWSNCIDKKIVAAARLVGIPTVSVHDYWSNYVERNSDQELNLPFVYMPDYMCVMDEYSKKNMIDLAFDGKKIIVTGQPNFDRLRRMNLPRAKNKVKTFLFISQCFREMYGDRVRNVLGFDEVQVAREIHQALAKRFSDFHFLIALHPKDDASKYSGLDTDERTDRYRLIQSSDLVLGMNSILLIEAAALGRDTLSYMPGLKKPEYAKINSINGVMTITDPPFRYQEKARRKFSVGYAFNGKAARNVENVVLNIMDGKPASIDR